MDREAGYRLALAQAERRLGEELPALGLLPPVGLSGPGLFAWLADRLDAFRADGVLCYQDYIAVGLMLELFRRGRRVPQDVAVVGCDNLPIGQSFSLGVTTYAYPSAELVRQGLRLLRARRDNPSGPPVKVMVPGEFIVRESSASR
jgi:LacI family transcriptional regulator